VRRIPAPAKLNLALVAGPRRDDGKHEVATVLQRLDLCDRIALDRGETLTVTGFPDDTIVRTALERLAAVAGAVPRWRVRIDKRVPVAAGLGGGSSDAASALQLANRTLAEPLPAEELHALAAEVGADVPFFLESGPALGTGSGATLERLELPQDFWVVLLLPWNTSKGSTADVYAAFDERGGAEGFAERRAELERTLRAVKRPRDLAALPPNDLASSPLAADLSELGAFRADVTGAGPVVYGLFMQRARADRAANDLGRFGRTWVTVPAWYG
jgi:4-diphosphocytidyl-2-C-methyl-D-erythritol kinase